jgi:hypothetical protein
MNIYHLRLVSTPVRFRWTIPLLQCLRKNRFRGGSDQRWPHNNMNNYYSHRVTFHRSTTLKGTVQRDFHSVFWHKWIGLGLNRKLHLVLNFFESPTILDQENFLHAVKEKSFQKNYIFQKIFINFLAAFQGYRMFWLAKTMLESHCIWYKLFWKPMSRTYKGFGKPLMNCM